jgi:hypothetical protein
MVFLVDLIFHAPFCFGFGDMASKEIPWKTITELTDTAESKSIQMARDEVPERNEVEAPGRLPEQKESKPTPSDSQEDSEDETVSPREFVPTEKIPADQAVDFPVDI